MQGLVGGAFAILPLISVAADTSLIMCGLRTVIKKNNKLPQAMSV